jgi:RNA polymerase sigma factor (sigma-70 family)
MPRGQLASVLRHLRRVAGPSPVQELTDAQLLARYVSDRDEEAFATLLRRYGRLVRSVCRRVLRHEQDIDDSFQVTFMVFASKAASIRKTISLASWLYGVAYRTAMNAKRARKRRSEEQRELEVISKDQPVTEAALRELQAILDHEVHQLPEKYRAPFVLCCLEGKSRAEAAQELGWKEGTVFCRLARARKELQQRLARRSVVLTAALCAVDVSRTETTAAVAPALANHTLEAALSFAAGKAMAADPMSAEIATLAKRVLRGLVATKLKAATTVVLAVGLMTGAAVIAHQALFPVPRGANPDGEPGRVAQAVDQPKPETRKHAGADPFGDPLPLGALVRMGTVRLRQVYPRVVFSPDGKTLISVGADHMVRTWDLATGKYLRGQLLDGAQHLDSSAITLAPDSKALVAWRSNRKSLPVYEVATGKELGRVPVRDDQLYRLALGPGGRTLATATDDHSRGKHFIRLWDVATGSERLLLEHTHFDEHLAFSPDGKYLGVAGRDDALRLWDVATGKLIQTLRADARYVAFTPDSHTVCGDFSGAVRLWDVVTGKELATLQATPRHDIACLAFSRDGKVLAAGGQGGLHLWDVAARKELKQLPDHMVTGLTFAPDGKVLAASRGSNIRLWDVATGKPFLGRPGHDGEVDAIAVSSDGKVVASASYSDGTLCLWDAGTGKLLHRPPRRWIAGRTICFSPDDKLVASGDHDGALHLWEVATGKEWRRFPIAASQPDEVKPFVDALRLSCDGRRLVALIRSDERASLQINVWDTATGELLKGRAFEGAPFSRFTPDANGVTVRTREGLALQDTITGKELMAIPGVVDLVPIAFSPDGQLVAVVRRKVIVALVGKAAGGVQAAGETTAVSLVEIATGREVLRIKTGPAYFLAFSPDGRVLATADQQVVRLWEVITGKEIFSRPRHKGLPGAPAQAAVTSVALFPGGRVLATGLEDGTILEWDLAPATRAAKELSATELDGLWADLAGPDARTAYRAIHLLVASPAQAVAYLRNHLQPVAEVDGKRVQRLLADLDSEEFMVREAATKELVKLGEQVEPGLRRVLEGKPSLEVRKRVEWLLSAPPTAPPAATLRTLRAIQILEWVATPEARHVLQKLSAGAPAARATRAAKASLERLAKRPPTAP